MCKKTLRNFFISFPNKSEKSLWCIYPHHCLCVHACVDVFVVFLSVRILFLAYIQLRLLSPWIIAMNVVNLYLGKETHPSTGFYFIFATTLVKYSRRCPVINPFHLSATLSHRFRSFTYHFIKSISILTSPSFLVISLQSQNNGYPNLCIPSSQVSILLCPYRLTYIPMTVR